MESGTFGMAIMVDRVAGVGCAGLGVSRRHVAVTAGQRCHDHDHFPGPDHPHRPRPRGAGVLARARKAPLRLVQRAWIVLAAADGQSNAQIAREVGVHVDTVRTWRPGSPPRA